MQSPLSDNPFPPAQSPPQPTPPPPSITITTETLRRTTISFGCTEPSRHRYNTLSDALAAANDDDSPEQLPAATTPISSRQDSRKTRPPPRRLSIRTPSSRSAPSWLPKTPLYAPPLTPLHSLLSPSYPFLVRDEKHYTSWEVQYSFSTKESAICGSFGLVVFLGPSLHDSGLVVVEEWISSLEASGCRVGGHGVSGAGEGQDREERGAGSAVVEGTIPLTKALIERIDEVAGSLDAERVLPYLRQKLHYIAENADGAVVSLGTLNVRIVSSMADIEEPGSRTDTRYFETVYKAGVGRVP